MSEYAHAFGVILLNYSKWSEWEFKYYTGHFDYKDESPMGIPAIIWKQAFEAIIAMSDD